MNAKTTGTGIEDCGIVADGEYTSTFAAEASRRAPVIAGVKAEEIDLIVLSTVTPDFHFSSLLA